MTILFHTFLNKTKLKSAECWFPTEAQQQWNKSIQKGIYTYFSQRLNFCFLFGSRLSLVTDRNIKISTLSRLVRIVFFFKFSSFIFYAYWLRRGRVIPFVINVKKISLVPLLICMIYCYPANLTGSVIMEFGKTFF